MNLKYNKEFRTVLSALSDGLINFKNTILSIGYLITLSSWRAARNYSKIGELKTSDICCVLGNGPSLKEALENDEVLYKDADVMCVNMFCQDMAFWKIKPRFYYVSDPAYFIPKTERHKKMVEILMNNMLKVDWDMILITGPKVPKCKLIDEIRKNKHIKIFGINCAQVSGFKWFRHFIYNHHLGMPRCQTIVNMVLTNAINLGYKTVYLYGADHSWTKDLRVDDNNVVCYGDRHVYDTNLQIIKKDQNIAALLDAFSKMFKSHYLIEEYAASKGTKIWNCTKGSFVDAYERLVK